MIVAGLLMVFMGAKLVLAIFGAGVFFIFVFFPFSFLYNVVLPSTTPVWAYAIVGIILVVAAGYIASFSRKFGQKYAVPLIGGWGGVILSLVVVEIIGLKSATLIILLSLGLGMVGFHAAQQLNLLVKALVTAFVGAGLTMKGASFYIIDIAEYDSDNVTVEQFQSDTTLWALIASLFLDRKSVV